MTTTVGVLTEIIPGTLEIVRTELAILDGSINIYGEGGGTTIGDIDGLQEALDDKQDLLANASATVTGKLLNTDWALFNAKQVLAYTKQQFIWRPTNVSAGNWVGTAGSSAGTHSVPTPTAAGNIYQGIKRSTWANVVTTANQVLGQRNLETIFHIGTVAGKGGFLFTARLGFDVWTNGGRAFAGLSAGTNSVVTGEPSVNNTTCGFAVDSTDNGLIYFMTRNSTTTTRVSTGLTLANNAGYDVKIYCLPNGTSIAWSIIDINSGAEVTGTASATLPDAATMMTAGVLASNASLAAVTAVQIGVARIYIECDY